MEQLREGKEVQQAQHLLQQMLLLGSGGNDGQGEQRTNPLRIGSAFHLKER
jgi:hypothetical protein